jgi:acyl carrier protein
MNSLLSREDIKNIVIEAIENRFDEDTKNTILKSKSFDGENTFFYKDLKLDSLDVIEFILEVEYSINQSLKLFGKKFIIDDNIINQELTLGILIDHIYNNINKDNN